MKKILAALDFRNDTYHVVDTATDLAQLLGGSVTLLHVLETPLLVTAFAAEVVGVDTLAAEAEQAAKCWISDFKEVLEQKNVPTEAMIRSGQASSLIVETAKKIGAEFVVIGAPRHTLIHDVIPGSTVKDVLKHSPCPVLIVPANDKPTRAFAADRFSETSLDPRREATAKTN